jgi:8-oxo-dGTP diphosphatase
MSPDRQIIVIGILYNQTRDRVLLCRRLPHLHQGGLWELPGGKRQQGETALQALKRELSEEINIEVKRAYRLVTLDHDYPDRKIRLDAWVVDDWSGTLTMNEDQPMEWVLLNELGAWQLPAANRRITKLLVLPSLYLITPDLKIYDDRFLDMTADLIRCGVRLIQFRSRSSVFHEHEQAVRRLISVCEEHACLLIYNGPVEHAVSLGAHGVHLSSDNLMRMKDRPLPHDKWVAASCHNLEEIRQAGRIGADFCVLSPVHRSPSHPGVNAMGWEEFSRLAEQAELPVYALGGIQAQDVTKARSSGAQGIAMISGVWSAPDPVGIIRNMQH